MAAVDRPPPGRPTGLAPADDGPSTVIMARRERPGHGIVEVVAVPVVDGARKPRELGVAGQFVAPERGAEMREGVARTHGDHERGRERPGFEPAHVGAVAAGTFHGGDGRDPGAARLRHRQRDSITRAPRPDVGAEGHQDRVLAAPAMGRYPPWIHRID